MAIPAQLTESKEEVEMMRMAVIGCGHWGPNHIRNFSTLPNVEVVACADLSEERLATINAGYPNVQAFTDYNELLADDEIDAVVVATPTASHFGIVKDSLQRGKHVLCEKPLTTSTANAEELVEIADKCDRLLMVGHVFIFNAGIQKLREYVRFGELGKVRYIHSTRTNLGPVRSDVNAVWDLASHDISILNYLLETEPVELSARGEAFLQPGIHDVAFITLSYPEQVLVNMHVSWLDPKKVRQVTVVGDKRMATWDDLSSAEPIRLYDKGVSREPYYEDFGQFQLLTHEGDVTIPKVNLYEPLKMQARQFVKSIEQGDVVASDGKFAVHVVRVLEAVETSMGAGGKPVRLKTG